MRLQHVFFCTVSRLGRILHLEAAPKKATRSFKQRPQNKMRQDNCRSWLHISDGVTISVDVDSVSQTPTNQHEEILL